MILRPVRPQSPFGPPITKAPVGLTRYFTLPLMRFFGSTGLMTCSITGLFDLLVRHVRRVLGGEHHRFDRIRLAVDVI